MKNQTGTQSRRQIIEKEQLKIAKQSAIFLMGNMKDSKIVGDTNVEKEIKEIRGSFKNRGMKLERIKKERERLSKSEENFKQRKDDNGMREFILGMEKKEFYQRHVYDKERINDSLRLMEKETEEIGFIKKKLLISKFFSNQKSSKSRSKMYNKLLSQYATDPHQEYSDKIVNDKTIYAYLISNKKQLLAGKNFEKCFFIC